jgi:hypothetical protein
MAWRFHAIDATLSPSPRLLDGVEVHKGLRNSSQDNLTHWLISTQVVYYGATATRRPEQLNASLTPLRPELASSRRHFNPRASPILRERPGKVPAPKWEDHFGDDFAPTVGEQRPRMHRHPPASSFQQGVMPSAHASVSVSSKGGMNAAAPGELGPGMTPRVLDEFLIRADRLRLHPAKSSFQDSMLVVPEDPPYRRPIEPHATVRDSLYGTQEGLMSTFEPAGQGRKHVQGFQRVALGGTFDGGAWG